MLTKKEKLLIHPWINKKYENHRRKVQSAGPAIDFRPPTAHAHVKTKLKKAQREKERLNDIERENRRLLQRLGEIMNTSRIENFWQTPPPKFLNRQKIYPERQKTAPIKRTTENRVVSTTSLSGSLARCKACSGRLDDRQPIIPEERVPWAPPRKTINQKLINQVPRVHKCCRFCC